MTSPAARDPDIDALRGMAMVAVVAIHLCARIPASSAWYASGRWIDHFCRFGVPLFLGVLGWSVGKGADSIGDWPAWLRRRLGAVGPAYLAWAVIYGIAAPIDGEGLGLAGDAGWPTRLLSALFGYGGEQLYYMTAYFGLLLVAPLVGLAVRGRSRVALTLALAGLALNGWLLWQTEQLVQANRPLRGLAGFMLQTEARTPLHWFGFFLAGVAIGAVPNLPKVPRWLAVAALAAHGWMALRPQVTAAFDDFWCAPILIAVSAAFLLWAPAVAAAGRHAAIMAKLRQLGEHSYGVYLSHVLWLRLAWLGGKHLPVPAGVAVAAAATWLGCALYAPLHLRLFARRPA